MGVAVWPLTVCVHLQIVAKLLDIFCHKQHNFMTGLAVFCLFSLSVSVLTRFPPPLPCSFDSDVSRQHSPAKNSGSGIQSRHCAANRKGQSLADICLLASSANLLFV